MRVRSSLFLAAVVVAASGALGCREASAPEPLVAPTTPGERAVAVVADGGRAFGRVRVSELRAHLSSQRLDDLGELILSKRFRLPIDVAREVDELFFVAYEYAQPDAIALLSGHFRAAEVREALAREGSTEGGSAKEAPVVNGERFFRVGQGDLYVVSDDMIAVGSRSAIERFLRRMTGAPALTAFPVRLSAGVLGAFRATGPSSAEELPPALRGQPLAVGLRSAFGSFEKQGETLVFSLRAEFSDSDLAKQAHARATPFARLVPTWTRNALPAAEVAVDGSALTVREVVDPAKLEGLAGSATTLVPR